MEPTKKGYFRYWTTKAILWTVIEQQSRQLELFHDFAVLSDKKEHNNIFRDFMFSTFSDEEIVSCQHTLKFFQESRTSVSNEGNGQSKEERKLWFRSAFISFLFLRKLTENPQWSRSCSNILANNVKKLLSKQKCYLNLGKHGRYYLFSPLFYCGKL